MWRGESRGCEVIAKSLYMHLCIHAPIVMYVFERGGRVAEAHGGQEVCI